MREVMTKAMARNIFFGGSIFFFVIFLGLTAHSHLYIVNTSTASMPLTESVARGKRVWEVNACINCHSIHGEGAYFAPEVGNVMTRWGVIDKPDDAFQTLKGWIEAQPSRVRRPQADAAVSPDRRRDPGSLQLPHLGRQDRHQRLAAERRWLRLLPGD